MLHLIEAAAARVAAVIGVAFVGFAIAAFPAKAADPNAPPETAGAFSAAAFAPLPQASRIEIRLMDDSPENLEIGWRVQKELERRGYTAQGGERLILTIETDVSIVPDAGSDLQAPAPGEKGDLDVIGFLRATLDGARTDERLWAAEAAYRRSDGDLPAGAKALAPLLVEQIGRSVELDSIRIR